MGCFIKKLPVHIMGLLSKLPVVTAINCRFLIKYNLALNLSTISGSAVPMCCALINCGILNEFVYWRVHLCELWYGANSTKCTFKYIYFTATTYLHILVVWLIMYRLFDRPERTHGLGLVSF